MRTFLLAVISLCLCACATYRQDLNRGQQLYEESDYERALAIFRVLEEDTDSLSLNDQARYAYLRGMTDYRLGFRPDARHWLALAKATEQQHPGGLTEAWRQRADEALADLNREVYGGGSPPAASDAGGAATGQTQKDTTGTQLPVGSCIGESDCASHQICQNNICVAR